MIASLGFAVALFFVLPLLLSEAAEEAAGSDLVANLAEGGIRLVIFVIYLVLIGLMSDVRRVFAYHGAEHKAISAHEADAPSSQTRSIGSAPPTPGAERPSS